MSLCKQLRALTESDHARLESLPMATSMGHGTVTLEEYGTLLRRLLYVHRGWEADVSRTFACTGIWDLSMERAEAIAHDLSALGLEVFDEPHPAAVSWLGEIRRVAEREPMIWLGVVYLFEGSRMGSMLLVRSLSRALGVAANVGMGLDYHLQGANESYAHWQRLKERLDGLPLVESDRMAACQGAKATFRMLHDVYSTPAELQLSTELT